MKKIKIYYLSLFFLFICSINGIAQIDKTFWFAAPNITSAHTDRPTRIVLNAFDRQATVTITQPANTGNFSTITVTIPSNGVHTIEFNTSLSANTSNKTYSDKLTQVETVGDLHSGDFGKDNSGILITSDELISGYYEVAGGGNDDLFSLKGANALGTEFIITSQMVGYNASNWDGGDTRARNRAFVVATENNTTITITPRLSLVGGSAGGTPFTVTLQRGEVYVITADNTWAACCNAGVGSGKRGNQIGGTFVISDKPVAITLSDDSVGHDPANGTGADLNGDQLVPTRLAGKEFITAKGNLGLSTIGSPAVKLGSGTYITDVVHVYPVNNNTSITVKYGGTTMTFGPKNMMEFFILENATNGPLYITSTDSVLVYQLGGNSNGSGAGNESGGGVIPQLTCTGSQSVSVVRSGGSTENFLVTILAKTIDVTYFTSSNSNAKTALINGFAAVTGTDWSVSTVNIAAHVGLGDALKISLPGRSPFHLGVTSGSASGVTRVGYFSNFGVASGEIVNTGGSTCEAGKALLQANVIGATGYQWKRNGTVLSGATNSLLTTCLPGNYEVVATAVCPATLTYALPYSLCGYTCVDKIELRLGANCRSSLELTSAVLPSDCIFSPEYYIKVNDLNPTNGSIVDGVSPLEGWVYGVYLDLDLNSATPDLLICQGRVVAKDYTAPAVTAPSEVELWCDDISSVLNKEDSWKTSSYKYFTGNLNKNAAATPDGILSLTDECSGIIQIKVTDRIDYTECGTSASSATGTIYATITRTFNVIDQRGSDTTVTQLIKFKRPSLSMVPVISGGSAYNTINGQTVWSTNGVKNPTATNYINSTSTADMIILNGCESPTATGAALKEVLRGYLRSIYRVGYLLPGDGASSPNGDTASIFDNFCNYSVDFTYKEYANCNNGKKYEIVTMITDWCTGTMISDPVVLSFEDASAPVFAAASTAIGSSSTTPKNVLGTTSSDAIKISVGTNECKGSLRLGTAWNMRDLSNLFNLSVTDNCSADKQKISLNYKFETSDYWNDAFYQSQGWTNTNYTIVSTTNGPNVVGLPIGKHRMKIIGHDGCNNKDSVTVYFDVIDNVSPVMICDDEIKVTLTANNSSNYFVLNNNSDADLEGHMSSRLYVEDIDEGSRDNCTIDSMYVRRKFNWTNCSSYLRTNMEYDVYSASGSSNGTVGTEDFEAVTGEPGMYFTPRGMQYVEYFCCDAGTGMVELWGSDTRHYNASGGNWNYCWSLITVEDKTSPSITRPNLNATYNATATNWINCTDKEWLQGPDLPRTKITDLLVNNNVDNTVNGKIATVKSANDKFGIPDIYGIECSGDVYYSVTKKLTCDTGVILRIWDVVKDVKGVAVSVKDTQLIWVQASHDYNITVPADVTTDCPNLASTSGAPSWNENGCDLLAISAVNEKVYNAAAADNACKKIYRTWTIINWCQVPNQFSCSTADPMNYARIIPRLNRTGSGTSTSNWAYAPASTTLAATTATHRFTKSNADATRDKGQGSLKYAQWLGAKGTDRAALGSDWPTTALSGAGVMRRQATSTTWSSDVLNNSTTGYLPSDVPSTGCALFGERTFAWSYTQVVKIQDSSKPTIDTDVATGLKFKHADAGASDDVNWNAAKKVFGIRGNYAEPTSPSINGTECQALVKFTFDVSDGCAASGPFNVEAGAYIVKKTSPLSTTSVASATVTPADPTQANKTFAVSVDGLGIDVLTGTQDYQLVVSVRDDCGNVTTDRIDFTVADIKAPAPVCVQNLTVSLMPTNAGGSPNAGMTVIKAIDVFQDINRVWGDEECTPTVKARIVRRSLDKVASAADVLALNDTIQATCNDRGGIDARVYLIDGAGNYNFCAIVIDVDDNANICGSSGSAAVAGAIQTETKATVEGVQVNLSGQSQKSFATGVNGLFVFNNLTAGADYTVTPSLNKGFLNGVSTYDLILISKHILGNQPLNTPYKLIAADVNNSKSITTLDMIQLRKLILNIEASFPSNQSWRFVDASYTFPNPSNPWATSFPEVKNVNDLNGTQTANFVAIKVGDVNGNAIANSTQGSIRNLTANLGIQVADMNLVAGNEYKVDFTAVDLSGVEGFQFTLNLDKKGLELVDIVPGIAGEEHFGIFTEEGVITASWNGEAKGGVLFSLVFRAREHINLSEVLNLNSRYTAAEAYKDGEVMNVGLNFNASKSSANYELYQNTPNPFAGETIIGFNLPLAGAATLTIQDVTGRTIKVINGEYAKGYNQVSLKSKELTATGVLTYILKAADYTLTKKMIVVE